MGISIHCEITAENISEGHHQFGYFVQTKSSHFSSDVFVQRARTGRD